MEREGSTVLGMFGFGLQTTWSADDVLDFLPQSWFESIEVWFMGLNRMLNQASASAAPPPSPDGQQQQEGAVPDDAHTTQALPSLVEILDELPGTHICQSPLQTHDTTQPTRCCTHHLQAT